MIISDLQDSNIFNQIYNIPANITTYQFLAIPNCRAYNIEVIAINAIGRSPSSTMSYSKIRLTQYTISSMQKCFDVTVCVGVPGCILVMSTSTPQSTTPQSTTPQSTESSSSSFTGALHFSNHQLRL